MTQDQALTILKSGVNVFLTGEPGSGKTYTVNRYINYLRRHDIEVAITASTGIAATHIGGVTIHSWSGIGIKTYISKYDLDNLASNEYVYKRLDAARVLILDEISMLAAETLEAVDQVCRAVRKKDQPFGGLQVIFVGDFFQLPPVNKQNEPTRFAFESRAWAMSEVRVCYLSEQHRQSDKKFLSVLSAIRDCAFTEEHLAHIDARKIHGDSLPDSLPRLFSHNTNVDSVNETKLGRLKGEAKEFKMTSQGNKVLIESLKRGCLSPEVLNLKPGARVMFTKNNTGKGFVNGTLGTIHGFSSEDAPIVKTQDNQIISVEPMEWSVEEGGSIKARIQQIPLRLAWAITVHKSQGMSLDAAVMDLSQVFEYGQGYVALSRVRNLAGLHVLGYNPRAFEVHPRIIEQDKGFRTQSLEVEETFGAASESDLAELHKNFIVYCGGNLKAKPEGEKPIKKKRKDTYLETFNLWNRGKNVVQIAEERKISAETVLTHVEKLVAEKKIDRREVARLISNSLALELHIIHAAFKELETDKLTPVYEKLGEAYSYDDLRLARLLL